MRILVLCQHYWPEPYPLPDVCEELVCRGHTVHVVTDIPNYPMGKIYPEYSKRKNRNQIHNQVKISRVFTIGRRGNALFRFLNYYSYALSSTLFVKKMQDEYDVVFTNQSSPVMMSAAAIAYARKHHKKVILYCMDLWPASLSAGGIGKSSVIYRFFWHISRRIYTNVDKILITSEMFRDYLKEQFEIADEKIQYHPQYSTDEANEALDGKKQQHKKTIDLLFAGNIGKAQCVHVILQAAEVLRDYPQLRWHVVGDGSEFKKIQALAEQMKLDNVLFYGRRPQEEMSRFFAKADAMLLTLTADEAISRTLPGKVQSYMAAGKPILAAANGETASVIEKSKCGFCAQAEDAEGLAEVVKKFLKYENKEQLGQNALQFYERHFTRDRFMDNLETVLREACDSE